MVPMKSLRWETAWELRKIAEDKGLLVLHSDTDYDLGEVAQILVEDIQVMGWVTFYLKGYQ